MELFPVKAHSRPFCRGTADGGVPGPATQAARLTVPGSAPACWKLWQQEQPTGFGEREGKLGHLMRVPELTVKVLNIRGSDSLLLLVFCYSGFGSKYGPSNSETLHMEERWGPHPPLPAEVHVKGGQTLLGIHLLTFLCGPKSSPRKPTEPQRERLPPANLVWTEILFQLK